MENQLPDFSYSLELNQVLNFMGYADPAKARPRIRKMAEEAIAQGPAFAESWAGAVEVPLCGIKQEEVYLKQGESQVCLYSKQLPNILRKSDAVSILLVTAGQKITDESRRLMAEGKMTRALAVSAVGSAMAVELMKALTDRVYQQAEKRGYGITLRVGPGYTGWHLHDQGTLFSFYDESIPITLNQGVMMTPEKSLLGMVGMNPGGKRAPEIEPCRICDLKGCDMRKAPFRGFSETD
jgi:hypothetical protein